MTSGVELLSHSAWCSWLRKVRAGKAEDIPYSKLMRDNDYAPDEEVIGDYATAEEAIAAAEQYFSYRLKERAERFSKRQIADVGCVYVAKVYLDEDGCPEEWEDPIFYKETVITPERY